MQVVLGRYFLEWRVDEGENRFETVLTRNACLVSFVSSSQLFHTTFVEETIDKQIAMKV